MADEVGPGPSVALLGTGIMGAAMGRSMLRAGLRLAVWNRTQAKSEPLAAGGAAVALTPAEAVRDAQVIVTVLTDAGTVGTVMAAAAPALRPGQVWIQASTVGAAGLEPLARFAAEHGLLLVDAPVVGTRGPAEQGALTVLAAGPDEARRYAEPVFDAIGRTTVWLGEAGTASRLKLVFSTWVVAVTTGAAEALALARGLGVDPDLFLQTVAGGAMDCPYLQAKGAAILRGDFSPNCSVAMAEKDAYLITEAARAAGIRLDAIPAAAGRFRRAAELGHPDEDMAATYLASFDA
jgi:3-hydroxyisobutyrate dehydrogenase